MSKSVLSIPFAEFKWMSLGLERRLGDATLGQSTILRTAFGRGGSPSRPLRETVPSEIRPCVPTPSCTVS